MLLNSITAPEPFLKSDQWFMQEKADGVRALIHVSDTQARAFSRSDLTVSLTAASATSLVTHFAGCILDVEVIGSKVVVFDLLSHLGTDLRGYSMQDRLKALQSKFPVGSAVLGGGVEMILTARTEPEKRAMLAHLNAAGAEGAVFKLKSAAYKAGRPSKGGDALKLKFVASISCVVTAVGVDGKANVAVALADGTPIASVSTIGRPVPKVGDVIEVKYLYCLRNGRLVQPVYKTIREAGALPDGKDKLQFKNEAR
jgi:bifunctional non-homologous end joining protein LigD